MNGAEWNSPLDANSQTEENTKWMLANQASSFNGCCAIYAPRYREASIFRYISATPDLYKKAGDFAYVDVDRAFTYFLEHYSKGRPFIIASHSQGTEHGFNLIRRRIDGTPLATGWSPPISSAAESRTRRLLRSRPFMPARRRPTLDA